MKRRTITDHEISALMRRSVMLMLLTLSAFALASPTYAQFTDFDAQNDAEMAPYVGMRLIGDDGAYLGRFDCNSIGNPGSEHGTQWSSTSLWDPRGRYGRLYSALSAYKEHGENFRPPRLGDDYGDTVVYVTMASGLQRTSTGARLETITPSEMELWLMRHCHHGRYRPTP